MKIALALVVVFLLAACGEEQQPEKKYERPPEYQTSSAVDYLLKETAKREIERLAEQEKQAEAKAIDLEAKLEAMPEDFPAAFAELPGAEWETGFARPPLTMVAQTVSGSRTEVLDRVKDNAKADGWTLEIETEDDGQLVASFQKDSRRAEVFVIGQPDSRSRVVTMLTDLELPPSAQAP